MTNFSEQEGHSQYPQYVPQPFPPEYYIPQHYQPSYPPQPGYYYPQYPQQSFAPPPAPPRQRRFFLGLTLIGALVLYLGSLAAGAALLHNSTNTEVAGQGSPALLSPGTNNPGVNNGGLNSAGLASATAQQQVGIVDVESVQKYQNAEAVGTGMVLPNGRDVLTNNHVVALGTTFTVTLVSTGKIYPAQVVGVDPTEDVAVLHLTTTAPLKPAAFGSSSNLKVGDAVNGVGNAEGIGGIPSRSPGSITALNQPVTAANEETNKAEILHGLIATNAKIVSGDSGGPLYNSSDKIIGVDTAASPTTESTPSGYAIPINKALSIATKIQAGQASSTIIIGYPAFLGVLFPSTSTSTTAPVLKGVLPDSPAAKAGLASGDTITAINGASVSTQTGLESALTHFKPGQKITVTWTQVAGTSKSSSLTLIQGPAK